MPTPYYRYQVTVVAPLARGEKVHQAWVFWLLAENEQSALEAVDQYCGWQITKRHLVTIEHSEPEKDSPRIFHEDNSLAEMPREVFSKLKAKSKKPQAKKSLCTPEQGAALRSIFVATIEGGTAEATAKLPPARLQPLVRRGLLKRYVKTGEYRVTATGKRVMTLT